MNEPGSRERPAILKRILYYLWKMKASELRIGNKFMDDYGSIHTVCGLDRAGFVFFRGMHPIYDKKIHQSLIRPVLTTEEWLMKFGVIKNHYSTERLQYNEPFYHVSLESKGWMFAYNEDFGWVIHPVVSAYNVIPIPYVHTFQNVCFALTGEELTVKETV